MPPKRKGKKKKEKPLGRAGGMTVEEKYQHTLKRIETLQDHLTLRTEIAGRSNQLSKVLHNNLIQANEHISTEKQNTHDIACNLKQQYASMETELSGEITSTKSDLKLLQEKLAQTEEELKHEKEEKRRIVKEKDEMIADLEYKIEHMESAYENILHDAFDVLVIQLEKVKLSWKKESLDIQSQNKDLLLEFGLNPLDM